MQSTWSKSIFSQPDPSFALQVYLHFRAICVWNSAKLVFFSTNVNSEQNPTNGSSVTVYAGAVDWFVALHPGLTNKAMSCIALQKCTHNQTGVSLKSKTDFLKIPEICDFW